MSVAPSERLAEHYALRLDEHWRQWFDQDCLRWLLAGPFRSPVVVDDLLEDSPPDLWPGFMLPDTLPVVSNDYGDWWCLRVDEHDQISEVIQWSHGGGDWLPVGRTMAQAALWDYVQHWRGPAIEIMQAAHEYPSRPAPDPQSLPPNENWTTWLAHGLGVSATDVQQLLSVFASHDYRHGLEILCERAWSLEAAACELVEIALQGNLARLADPKLAMRCGINWTPEYTSWLFDTRHISDDARRLLLELKPDVRFEQDWAAAARWSALVRSRRGDLSWAGDIGGWEAWRSGDATRAAQLFFENRRCSAFTDQSVRLRSHWFAEHLGKFSVAQLQQLKTYLTPEQQLDPYLQLLWREPVQRTRAAVREHWLTRAREQLQSGQFADSYESYVLAGWDLGAERMSDYVEILDGLVLSATQAGWSARARIAAVHAQGLKRRLALGI